MVELEVNGEIATVSAMGIELDCLKSVKTMEVVKDT